MLHVQPQEMLWRDLKCAKCHLILENPVQLPACYHILCFDCEKILEANFAYNINCPKCGVENARPRTLQIISGVEHSFQESVSCDISIEHGVAMWSCFQCGLNLCGACRVAHEKDHTITLLAHYDTLKNRIWEHPGSDYDRTAGATSQEVVQTQRPSSIVQCPMCSETSCEHMKLLQKLNDVPHNGVTDCLIEGHDDKKLKYFCTQCWIPICGDCSLKGVHKLHQCDDLSSCGKKFLANSLATCKENLHMLISSIKQDVTRIKTVEEWLRQHVTDTDRELNTRKIKILEETEHAFDMAITDAEHQGRNILRDYRDKLDTFERYTSFLLSVEEAFESLTINEKSTLVEYARAFNHQEAASRLISQINMKYQTLTAPAEQRLVLPEVETLIRPPATLAQVSTEWKQLKLAFFFKLHDDLFIKSIVVTDTKTCLLSTKKAWGRSGYDIIVQWRYNSSTNSANSTFYDTRPGDYFIDQLQSGEIVASYVGPIDDPNHPDYKPNALCYSKKLPMHCNSVIEFKDICHFEFPPYSIATTKDNNILVCVGADNKKGMGYLMLMNLIGNELKSTVKQGSNKITPNYVAVSSSGEICVSDTEGSSIIILDQELEIKERLKYKLPSSMKDIEMFQFQPHGVCYDNYGRIIVADQINSCVLRLTRAQGSNKYKLEPLLSESPELPNFRYPSLVAMGKEDSRLWVVCAQHVFVFDYCI